VGTVGSVDYRLLNSRLMLLQNHAFIKKFEDKDLDLRILVESLEQPMNVPE